MMSAHWIGGILVKRVLLLITGIFLLSGCAAHDPTLMGNNAKLSDGAIEIELKYLSSKHVAGRTGLHPIFTLKITNLSDMEICTRNYFDTGGIEFRRDSDDALLVGNQIDIRYENYSAYEDYQRALTPTPLLPGQPLSITGPSATTDFVRYYDAKNQPLETFKSKHPLYGIIRVPIFLCERGNLFLAGKNTTWVASNKTSLFSIH